jgi:hypothetical protein
MIQTLLRHFFPKRQDEFVLRAISRLNHKTSQTSYSYPHWETCQGTLLKDISRS